MFKVAEIEIVYKRTESVVEFPTSNCSKASADYFMKCWNMNTIDYAEQFKVLLLDSALKPLGIVTIATGGTQSVVVDVRLVFAAALKANATSIIVAHNHPSGTLKASNHDIQITDQIRKASLVLDIKLLDHLILTRNAYFSFADNGLL